MSTRLNNKPDLPKLLSVQEFAAHIGYGKIYVRDAIKNGRIPAAQLVGRAYVIPIDAIVKPRFLGDMPEEAFYMLPQSDREGGDFDGIYGTEFSFNKNTSFPPPNMVELPGFKRYVYDNKLGVRQIKRLTKTHNITITNAKAGKPVRVDSANRLAKGLGVDIEVFLDPREWEYHDLWD